MNDQLPNTNREEENIARKLNQASQQIDVNPHFAAEWSKRSRTRINQN